MSASIGTRRLAEFPGPLRLGRGEGADQKSAQESGADAAPGYDLSAIRHPDIGGPVDIDEPVPDEGQAPIGGRGEDPTVPAEALGTSTPVGPEREPGGQSTSKPTSRRLVIGGAIVVVVAAVVAGLVLFISSVSNAITTGTGTATITWTPATGTSPTFGNLPQPFDGTIKGIRVSGINRTTISANDSALLFNPSGKTPTEVQVFRLNGTFGGKAFALGVYYQIRFNPSSALQQVPSYRITVKGTYGTSVVNGSITPPSTADLRKGSVQVDFHGTIGDFKVSGIIYPNTGDRNKQTARATFTVSK
jgi:hypothetical protein